MIQYAIYPLNQTEIDEKSVIKIPNGSPLSNPKPASFDATQAMVVKNILDWVSKLHEQLQKTMAVAGDDYEVELAENHPVPEFKKLCHMLDPKFKHVFAHHDHNRPSHIDLIVAMISVIRDNTQENWEVYTDYDYLILMIQYLEILTQYLGETPVHEWHQALNELTGNVREYQTDSD